MSVHMLWGLIGFGIAVFFWVVYEILKRRGVSFLWYHPLFAGITLLFILYLLESFFADISTEEVMFSWDMMIMLSIIVSLVIALLVYRILTASRRLKNKKIQ